MGSARMIRFGSRCIGPESAPVVIAEMSGNHNQSLDRALEIVDAAADAGADAIKLQTYLPETMTLDVAGPGFTIDDPKSLWYNRKLFDLYREAHTPWEWHAPIIERAKARGMEWLSTPFDASAVKFLELFDPPAYKIASFELTDLALIECAARTGRPLILSTGMGTVAEIDQAVRAARSAGARDIVLLKCTSTYPASPGNSNVATVPHMRDLFGTQVGLSDHTAGIGVAVAAVALGAAISAFDLRVEGRARRRTLHRIECARRATRLRFGAASSQPCVGPPRRRGCERRYPANLGFGGVILAALRVREQYAIVQHGIVRERLHTAFRARYIIHQTRRNGRSVHVHGNCFSGLRIDAHAMNIGIAIAVVRLTDADAAQTFGNVDARVARTPAADAAAVICDVESPVKGRKPAVLIGVIVNCRNRPGAPAQDEQLESFTPVNQIARVTAFARRKRRDERIVQARFAHEFTDCIGAVRGRVYRPDRPYEAAEIHLLNHRLRPIIREWP